MTIDGVHAHVSYDGAVTELLRAATSREVLNLTSREADLEEIFLAFYRPDSEPDPEKIENAQRDSERAAHVR